MSIILNALRARDAAKDAGEKALPKEGLFFGAQSEPTRQNPARISLLIMILFAASAFAMVRFGAKYFTVQSVASQAVMQTPKPLSELKLPEPKPAPVVDIAAAKALFAQDRIDESLAAYEQLIKANPNDAMLQNDVGLILMKKDRLLEAEVRIQSALKVNPSCAECYNNLGMLSLKMGHMNDAEKYLKMAATLKSGYADPYFNLGVLFEKAGDNANAVAQYEKFLKTTSDANAPIALQVKKRIESLTEPPESNAN